MYECCHYIFGTLTAEQYFEKPGGGGPYCRLFADLRAVNSASVEYMKVNFRHAARQINSEIHVMRFYTYAGPMFHLAI